VMARAKVNRTGIPETRAECFMGLLREEGVEVLSITFAAAC